MGNTFFFAWEPTLMIWLQEHLGSVGTDLALFFTLFGEQLLLIAVLGFLYWCWDKNAGRFVGMNLILCNVWNPLLKNIFLRRRPYFDNPAIKCLKPVDAGADLYDIAEQGFSFPSGHSSSAASAYGSLPAYYKGKSRTIFWIIGLLLPLLVGISRVCLGVHFPTDVIAGWLLGAAAILLLPLLAKLIKKKWLFYLLLFVTAMPGFFYCKTTDYYTGMGMLAGFFLGDLFEERFVKFKNTHNIIRCILRLVGGVALYFGLNTVLKLPFPSDFLSSPTVGAYLVRTLRYTVILFIDIGVYPMLFKYTAGIGRKKQDKTKHP